MQKTECPYDESVSRLKNLAISLQNSSNNKNSPMHLGNKYEAKPSPSSGDGGGSGEGHPHIPLRLITRCSRIALGHELSSKFTHGMRPYDL